MKLATFDIFDTCLIRKCGSPEVIPYLVAKKLWKNDISREEYVIARTQASQKVGINATLKDIYAQEVLRYFPDYTWEEIMQTELEVESEQLVANPVMKKKVEEIRTQFSNSIHPSHYGEGAGVRLEDIEGRVLFLSDMYLPSSFLEKILIREGFLPKSQSSKVNELDSVISKSPHNGGDLEGAVIVSCEWSARKDTGTLYKAVRKKYNPSEWIHFGDNFRSDIKQAKKNGVNAIQVHTEFTPIEKKIQSLSINSRHPEIYAQLAGIMRYARLSSPFSIRREDMRKDSPSHYGEELGVRLGGLDGAITLASNYIAPLYIPYVSWVLKQTKEMGIKRLHFLSRDGYIMYKIAEALQPEGIELNYLFVSRKSLIPAFLLSRFPLSGGLRGAFLKITDRQHLIGRSVDFLLGQLQLNKKELKEKYGIEFLYNKIFNKQQQEDFLSKIFGEPEDSGESNVSRDSMEPRERFREEFQKDLKKKGDLVLEYLKQEGLMDGTLQAMVDIGWLGTTRLMINEIVSNANRDEKVKGISNVKMINDIKGIKDFKEVMDFKHDKEDLENIEYHDTLESPFNKIPTFYLGIRSDVYPSSYGPYLSYFPMGSLSTEATGLIENYYSASPWPSTMGYKPYTDHLTHQPSNSQTIIPSFKKGEEFKMTPIVEANIETACLMAKELKPLLETTEEDILFRWAKTTLNSLSKMEFKVDLTPMSLASEFDGVPMVKKLSFSQLINIIFLGGRATAFDRGSLDFTLGRRISKRLWKLHEITGYYRTLAYRVLLKIKR